jgi:hypothetical protein
MITPLGFSTDGTLTFRSRTRLIHDWVPRQLPSSGIVRSFRCSATEHADLQSPEAILDCVGTFVYSVRHPGARGSLNTVVVGCHVLRLQLQKPLHAWLDEVLVRSSHGFAGQVGWLNTLARFHLQRIVKSIPVRDCAYRPKPEHDK